MYSKSWESLAGVTGGIWRRVLPARRELEAGTCPPGRGFEGTTQRGQGEVRDAHIPPFPFRFFHSRQFRFAKLRSLLRKRALLFPHSLSPLVRSAFVDRIIWGEVI